MKNFLANYAPNYGPNVYNDSGNARGFPDVSAIGWVLLLQWETGRLLFSRLEPRSYFPSYSSSLSCSPLPPQLPFNLPPSLDPSNPLTLHSLSGVTVFNGETLSVGGTSLSSPIFAGLVTLLNEARIAAGKGPLGFLNPTLYANPDAFHDITIGGNPGCGTPGFNATPGWDPVTGLGTPDFGKLRDVVLALP